MRQELLLRRIATKCGADPDEFTEMMTGDRPWPTECLPWTGGKTVSGLVRARGTVRTQQPRPRILDTYVHRYLLTLLHGPHDRSKRLCNNSLCCNPAHYRIADTPWTLPEVQELVNLYLADNRRPLDPTHPLFQDIPPDMLEKFQ